MVFRSEIYERIFVKIDLSVYLLLQSLSSSLSLFNRISLAHTIAQALFLDTRKVVVLFISVLRERFTASSAVRNVNKGETTVGSTETLIKV